jgi:hypothetical protein
VGNVLEACFGRRHRRGTERALAIEVKQLMDRGLWREEAAREARRRFGNRPLIMEAAREVCGFAGVARLWQNLEYSLRMLRRGIALIWNEARRCLDARGGAHRTGAGRVRGHSRAGEAGVERRTRHGAAQGVRVTNNVL